MLQGPHAVGPQLWPRMCAYQHRTAAACGRRQQPAAVYQHCCGQSRAEEGQKPMLLVWDPQLDPQALPGSAGKMCEDRVLWRACLDCTRPCFHPGLHAADERLRHCSTATEFWHACW